MDYINTQLELITFLIERNAIEDTGLTDDKIRNIVKVSMTVDYEDLEDWVADAPENTSDNPYKIKILNIPSSDITSDNILSPSPFSSKFTSNSSNNNKCFDLSETELPFNENINLSYCPCVISPKLPDGVKTLSFYSCSLLREIYNIPNSVTDMESCFYNCTSLTTVPNIPNSVTNMEYCFGDCTSLTTVPNIPNSVTNMGYCFRGCTFLTTVPNIPNSVTNMGYCFYNCTSLTTVPNIPDSVTNMSYCFYGCTSLTTIESWEIEDVSKIDITNCFYGCNNLTDIYIRELEVKKSLWKQFLLDIDYDTKEVDIFKREIGYEDTLQSIGTISFEEGSKLVLFNQTDELVFGDSSILTDENVQKMGDYQTSISAKNEELILDPAKRNFVMWADDLETFKSNLSFKASSDDEGNLISKTYATKEELDGKADKSNTRYKTMKQFYGTRTGRYIKIGSIPISSGVVSFAALDIAIFSSARVGDYPVGVIELGMSSGSYDAGFNINGYSTIPLDSEVISYPKIIVEKTSTDYNLYIDDNYNYLCISITEGETRGYTRCNFEELSSLSGTIVYHSTTSNNIKYIENFATKPELNFKTFGSPAGQTKYVTITSTESFGGGIVSCDYAGQWVFSCNRPPFFIGDSDYRTYGLTGYAWSADGTKLYLRFSGYRGIYISCPGRVGVINISDWSSTAPSGVSFSDNIETTASHIPVGSPYSTTNGAIWVV